MKIIIISAVFPPEPLVTAKISKDLADYLSNDNEVIVLAPRPSRPINSIFPKLKHTNFRLEYLNSFVYPHGSIWGRLFESFSFGLACYFYLSRSKSVSKVYLNTWPIFGQLFVSFACLQKKIPYYLHIQDIYPESLSNKLPTYLRKIINFVFIKIDRYNIKKSCKTIVVSKNMLRIISDSRKICIDKFVLVNNWQDERNFESYISDWSISKFTFMYLGNIGPVAGIENLINAFVLSGINAKLVIAGSGSKKNDCINLANNFKNYDISFIDVPPGTVPETQSNAHVLILPTINNGAITSIPSKLPAYMFSAKPIFGILNKNSDTADAIIEAGCGWIVEPNNFNEIAQKFKEIISISNNKLITMGLQGREFALKNYTKNSNLSKLVECILS